MAVVAFFALPELPNSSFNAGALSSAISEPSMAHMLKGQKDWQRYIENHILTIAEKNNIRREHLQWACAAHLAQFPDGIYQIVVMATNHPCTEFLLRRHLVTINGSNDIECFLFQFSLEQRYAMLRVESIGGNEVAGDGRGGFAEHVCCYCVKGHVAYGEYVLIPVLFTCRKPA